MQRHDQTIIKNVIINPSGLRNDRNVKVRRKTG